MSWKVIGQKIVHLLISGSFPHIGWLAVLFEGKVTQPGCFLMSDHVRGACQPARCGVK